MKKRLLSALLVLVMVLTMLPVTAMAVGAGNTITYFVDGVQFAEDTLTDDPYVLRDLRTEDDKTIDGWYSDSEYTSKVNSLEDLGEATDYTLYGKIDNSEPEPEPVTVTVTLNAGEGIVTPSEITVTVGKAYGTLPTPERDSYNFVNWTLNGTAVTAETIVTEETNHTLTAVWEEKTVEKTVTVTLNAGEGTVTPSEITVTVGEAYGTLPIPELDGFNFVNWTLGSTVVTATTTVTEEDDHTLTAVWEENTPAEMASYTVEHYLQTWNRKTGEMEYVLDKDATQTFTAEVGKKVTATAKNYSHYTLNKNESTVSGTVTADDSLVLKLRYDRVYTIRYTDGVPGVEVFEDQVYYRTYGERTPKFDDTDVRLGWFFLGWSPKVSKTVTGDVTYVAQWADLNWNVSNVKKPTTPMAFTDVSKSDWFYSDVKYVYENGLMEGTSDTKFSPYSTLTRGMVATILYRMEGAPKTRYNGMFRDVDNYKWYTDGVEWAAAKGIVEGFEDGNFRPNEYVTREQLATMLYRYAQYKNDRTSARVDLDNYKDAGSIHNYAVTAVRWALAEDLISANNGNIQPRADATRAEVAVSVATFAQNIAR